MHNELKTIIEQAWENRALLQDPAVQQARLALCIGVKNVIFNVLTMFKINVPEKM